MDVACEGAGARSVRAGAVCLASRGAESSTARALSPSRHRLAEIGLLASLADARRHLVLAGPASARVAAALGIAIAALRAHLARSFAVVGVVAARHE
jgi:hypothetical protein